MASSVPDSRPGAGAQDFASIEALLSQVLLRGVLASAAVILLGVALFVAQGGARAILFARAMPAEGGADPQSLRAVLDGVRSAQPAAVTDLGLLLLMVTPVASVAISILAFAARRDWLYVAISAFVFAMLMLGFAIGSA